VRLPEGTGREGRVGGAFWEGGGALEGGEGKTKSDPLVGFLEGVLHFSGYGADELWQRLRDNQARGKARALCRVAGGREREKGWTTTTRCSSSAPIKPVM